MDDVDVVLVVVGGVAPLTIVCFDCHKYERRFSASDTTECGGGGTRGQPSQSVLEGRHSQVRCGTGKSSTLSLSLFLCESCIKSIRRKGTLQSDHYPVLRLRARRT